MSTTTDSKLVEGKMYIIQAGGWGCSDSDIGKPLTYLSPKQSSAVEGISYKTSGSLSYVFEGAFGDNPIEYNPEIHMLTEGQDGTVAMTDKKVEGFEVGCTYKVISYDFDFASRYWEDVENNGVGSTFMAYEVTTVGSVECEEGQPIALASEFHMCKKVETPEERPDEATPSEVTNIDTHYEKHITLTPEDIERGSVKLDPYRIYSLYNISKRDEHSCLAHLLKNTLRDKVSNSQEREIVGMYKTIKRMAELNGIKLEGV